MMYLQQLKNTFEKMRCLTTKSFQRAHLGSLGRSTHRLMSQLSVTNPINAIVISLFITLFGLISGVAIFPLVITIWASSLAHYVFNDCLDGIYNRIADLIGRKPVFSTMMERAMNHTIGISAILKLMVGSRTMSDFTASCCALGSLLGLEETMIHGMMRRLFSGPRHVTQAVSSDTMRRLAGPVAMLIGIFDFRSSYFGSIEGLLFRMNRARTSVQGSLDTIIDLLKESGLVSDPESEYLSTLRARVKEVQKEISWMVDLRETSLCSFTVHVNSQRALACMKMLETLITEATNFGYKSQTSNLGRIFTQLVSIQNRYKELFDIVRRTILESGERVRPVGICIFGPSKVGKSNLSTELERLVKCQLVLNSKKENATPFEKSYGDAASWTCWDQNTADDFDTGYNGDFIHRIDDAFQDKQHKDHLSLINFVSNVTVGTNQAALGDKGRKYVSKLVFVSCNYLPTQSITINCVDALWNRFPITIRAELKEGVDAPPREKDNDYQYLDLRVAGMHEYASAKANRLMPIGTKQTVQQIVDRICEELYANLALYTATMNRTAETNRRMQIALTQSEIAIDDDVIESSADDRLSAITTGTFSIGDGCDFGSIATMLGTVNPVYVVRTGSLVSKHAGRAIPEAVLVRDTDTGGLYLYGSRVNAGSALVPVSDATDAMTVLISGCGDRPVLRFLDVSPVLFQSSEEENHVPATHVVDRMGLWPRRLVEMKKRVAVDADDCFKAIDEKLQVFDDVLVASVMAVSSYLGIPVSSYAEELIRKGSSVVSSKWFLAGVGVLVVGIYTYLKVSSGFDVESRNPARRLRKRVQVESRGPRRPRQRRSIRTQSLALCQISKNFDTQNETIWEQSEIDVGGIDSNISYDENGTVVVEPFVDEPIDSEWPEFVSDVLALLDDPKYGLNRMSFVSISGGLYGYNSTRDGMMAVFPSINRCTLNELSAPRYILLEFDQISYPEGKRWTLTLQFSSPVDQLSSVFDALRSIVDFVSFDLFADYDRSTRMVEGWLFVSSTKSLDTEILLDPSEVNLSNFTLARVKNAAHSVSGGAGKTQSVDDATLVLATKIIENTLVAVFASTNPKQSAFDPNAVFPYMYAGTGIGEYIFTLAHGKHRVGDIVRFCRLGKKAARLNPKQISQLPKMFGICISVNADRDSSCFQLLSVAEVKSLAAKSGFDHHAWNLDPNPVFPQDVVKHLNTETELKQILSVKQDVFIWCPTTGHMAGGVAGHAKYSLFNGSEELKFDGMETQATAIAAPTQAGDCGGTYFLANPRVAKKILGFHHGGAVDSSLVYGTLFSLEQFRIMTQRRGNVQMASLDEPFKRETDFGAIHEHPEPVWASESEDPHQVFLDKAAEGPAVPHGPACRSVGMTTFNHRPQGSGLSKCNIRGPFFGCYPIVREPPPFSPRDRRIRVELPRDRDGVPSLTLRANNAMASEVPPIDTDILKKCVDQIIEVWSIFLSGKTIGQRNATLEDMIDLGLNGRQSNKFVKGLVLKKSSGLPWSTMKGTTRKSDFVRLNEEGRREFVDTPNARLFVDLLRRKFALGKRGVRMLSFQACSLKDQCIKKKHVENAKVRVFYPASFEDMLFGKALFGDFWEQYQTHWEFFRNSIAINEISYQWTELADALRVHPNFMDLDFTEWDKHAPSEFIFAAYTLVIETIARVCPDEWREARYVHAYNMIRSVMVDGNTAFMTEHSMKSGSSDTTPINSIIGMLYLFYAHAVAVGHVDYEEFDNQVRSFHNGDDMVISVSDEIAGLYNYNSLTKIFESIGLIATPGMKGEFDGNDFSSFEHLTFLKRRFVQQDDVVVAPLDYDSIIARFGYTRNSVSDVPEWTGVLRSAMDEFWLHGREVYEENRALLLAWISNPKFPEFLRVPCALILCKTYDDHAFDMSMMLHGNDNVTRYVENMEFPTALAEYISENHLTLYEALSDLDVVDLGNRMTRVEDETLHQQEQITGLGMRLDATDRRVGRVEGLMESLETTVSTFEDQLVAVAEQNVQLSERVDRILDLVADLEGQVFKLDSTVDALSIKVTKNTNDIANIKTWYIRRNVDYAFQFQNEPNGWRGYITSIGFETK